MGNNILKHQRRSMRLKEYDYSNAGAYFITIVSFKRINIFGSINDGHVQLNQIGNIVEIVWLEIPLHYPNVTTDAYVIMPNHFHGIIIIHNNDVGARHAAPLQTNTPKRKSQPLGVIVGSFKSAATRQIHRSGLLKQKHVWQRNYYEHIIRDDEDFRKISDYIELNPINWEFDHENITK